MFEQQGFVCFPVQTSFTGIYTRFPYESIKAPGQEVLYAAALTDPLNDTIVDEVMDSSLEVIGDGFAPPDEVDDQKIFRTEGRHPFLPDLFQKTEKLGVLDFPVKGKPYGISICPR